MTRAFALYPRERQVWTWAFILVVLLAAAVLGAFASTTLLAVLLVGIGILFLLRQPVLGLVALIIVALVVPKEYATGTQVSLNLATFLVPGLLVVWLLHMVRVHHVQLVSSRTTAPLLLFVLASLMSLVIGTVLWNPLVPRPDNLILVQLAQWAIFALSAGAFLLTGNLIKDEIWLQRLVFAFLLLAGILAIASALVDARSLVNRFATIALIRAPFWILLCSLAAGQLLFNQQLGLGWRVFALVCLVGAAITAFAQEKQSVSNWVGIAAATGVLLWLRFPRLRWPIAALIVALALSGILAPTLFEFAGGEQEWNASGGSRLALMQRVIDVSTQNPITGLGPAAYRQYTAMEPLAYGNTVWILPSVNSHNNYVDLFAHTGIVGLGLFLWFMVELALLCWRMRRRFQGGFAAGYVNAMLATWVSIMIVMLLLDWFLPHVYNVGFVGFQASVLVWMFMGGLVALENMRNGASDAA